MIYLIQGVRGGPVKIGYAADPEQRLRGLQTSHHEELRIVATAEGGREQERALHLRLKQFRIKGEWFEPLSDVLRCLATDNHRRIVMEAAREEIVEFLTHGGLATLVHLIGEPEDSIKSAAVGYPVDPIIALKLETWAEDVYAKRCLARMRAETPK